MSRFHLLQSIRETLWSQKRSPAEYLLDREHSLSANGYHFVAAAAECILPRHGAFPGAIAAGAADFIDVQLADPSFAVFLDEIEAYASQHPDFATSSTRNQARVMRQLQAEEPRLFHVLLTLSIEAVFSDPKHGGNRDRAGWQLLGIASASSDPACGIP